MWSVEMCAFHERGIVCALYCLRRHGIVTWSLWAQSYMVPASTGFVQNFVYVLLMYCLCINVLCIVMQCSASMQLCCFLSRKRRNACLPRAWKCVPSTSMECVLCTVSAAAMNVLCSSQTEAFITLHLPYQSLQIWWNNFVNSWNGTSLLHALLHHATFDLTIQTDSSGSGGYGALSHPHWFEYVWPPEWFYTSIMAKELVPICYHLLRC